MDAADQGIARIIALGKCEKIADVHEAHVDGPSVEREDRQDGGDRAASRDTYPKCIPLPLRRRCFLKLGMWRKRSCPGKEI
jgi:hypothetical protein